MFHKDRGIMLMNTDAKIVLRVLERMRRRGIVVLPIHDSFVVEEHFEAILREEMEAACMHFFGAPIPIDPPAISVA